MEELGQIYVRRTELSYSVCSSSCRNLNQVVYKQVSLVGKHSLRGKALCQEERMSVATAVTRHSNIVMPKASLSS